MKPIQLALTLDEVNMILEALGQLPFVKVHQLIGKIHQQAEAQLREGEPAPQPQGQPQSAE